MQNSFLFTGSTTAALQGKVNVFLPGWGFAGRIIALTHPDICWLTTEHFIRPATLVGDLTAFLAAENILSVNLIGWSLGANLALDFALDQPEKIASLTLCSLRRQWPAPEIEAIRAELARQPESFLISFYRKCFLGYKKLHTVFHQELEGHFVHEARQDPAALEEGLQALADFTFPADDLLRRRLDGIDTHVIHGRKDVVAPVDQRGEIPRARTKIIKNGGHAVFADPDFILPGRERKQNISRKFSRAAATYDAHAGIQKELAERLALEIPGSCSPATILETGCGTGTYTMKLARRFPAARITALDFSEGMVEKAREKTAAFPNVRIIHTDAENYLEQCDSSYDMITSNATMQWFDNLDTTFYNCAGLLTENGLLHFSIFGPRSLQELKAAMEHVFRDTFRMPSVDFADRDMLEKKLAPHFAGLRIEDWSTRKKYDSLRQLLVNIKKTGTSGWHPSPPILSRKKLDQLDNWFAEKQNGYDLTYQIFFFHCRKQ